MGFGSIGGLEWLRSRGRGMRMRHVPVVTRAAAAFLPPHEKRAYDSGTVASRVTDSPSPGYRTGLDPGLPVVDYPAYRT